MLMSTKHMTLAYALDLLLRTLTFLRMTFMPLLSLSFLKVQDALLREPGPSDQSVWARMTHTDKPMQARMGDGSRTWARCQVGGNLTISAPPSFPLCHFPCSLCAPSLCLSTISALRTFCLHHLSNLNFSMVHRWCSCKSQSGMYCLWISFLWFPFIFCRKSWLATPKQWSTPLLCVI